MLRPSAQPERRIAQFALLKRPLATLLDFGVHRIRSKVQVTRPGHNSAIERNLCEERRVGEGGEDPGLRRMHQSRQIDGALKAVGKCNPEAETGKRVYPCHAPRRPGRDFSRYGSGRILSGI